jgi:hypothetical protein
MRAVHLRTSRDSAAQGAIHTLAPTSRRNVNKPQGARFLPPRGAATRTEHRHEGR